MTVSLSKQDARPLAQRIELLVVFLVGFALLSHIYAWNLSAPLTQIGAPGNDSFYHTRMAALIPEHGLLHEFHWLRWTWFTQDGNRFVSHHYGFHMLLLPFITVSELLGYDALTGGRWFMCTIFGLQLAVLDAILMTLGVRFRLLWLALVLLWPHQFFERQAFIRAIGPSTLALLVMTWLVLNRRHLLLVIMVAGFLHLYLGAVLYVPVLIGAAVFAGVVTARRWRDVPWQLAAAGFAGWAIGVATHPYQAGMFEFLQMQVFGTGLSPDIEVGREWRPYNDVWWFTGKLAGATLLTLGAAALLRLRFGPRLDANALTLLLMQGVFLILVFKARRFVEFWPPFALAASAALAAPALARVQLLTSRWRSWQQVALRATGVVGLLLFGTAALLKWGSLPTMPNAIWLMAAAILLLVLPLIQSLEHARASRLLGDSVAATALLTIAVGLAAPRLEEARVNSRCRYDLPEFTRMMAHLRKHSAPDSIVFTDDWDIFPAYFYHNTHNRFVVGLDPKFTHERRPDLWDRFVRITRGQVPGTVRTQLVTANGHEPYDMQVELSDIRQHFEAQYVIVDDDHDKLADLLNEAWDLAEPFWPVDSRDFAAARLRVYRVRDSHELVPPRPQRIVASSLVYLSDLPIRGSDRARVSVDQTSNGGPLVIEGRTHLRGVSLRGHGELRVDLPEGRWQLRGTLALRAAPQATTIVRLRQADQILWRRELRDQAIPIDVALDAMDHLTIELIGPSDSELQFASPILIRTPDVAENS